MGIHAREDQTLSPNLNDAYALLQVVESVASVDASVAALAVLLQNDGHGVAVVDDDDQGSRGGGGGGACFVGHSLGSTCVAWMRHARDPKGEEGIKGVKKSKEK